ncbi:phage tail sheath family protein [Arthrobacter humicola]
MTDVMAAPGVRVELVDPPPATEPGRVDALGLVAVCERGPVGVPVRITSWRTFTDTFGFFIPNGLGAYAAKAFFDNGGSLAHVVRAVAPEHTTTIAGAQPVDRTRSVVAAIDGLASGGSATLSGATTRVHQHLVLGLDPVSRTVTWDRPLDPELDPAVNGLITVVSGAGVARATFADTAGNPALMVQAVDPGSAGNRLTVRLSSGRRTAAISVGTGTAAALPVSRVDGFTAGSLVLVTQTSPTFITQWRVVAGVDGGTRVLLLEAPLPIGPGGFDLTQPISCETDSFTLTVADRGRLLEVHPDLVLVPQHPRWALSQVKASSRLIRLELPPAGLPAVPRHPAAALPSGVSGDPATAVLTGGRDGTAGLTVADLLGDELAGDGRGLAALSDLTEPALIVIPDLVAGPVAGHVTLPRPPSDPCDPCAPPAPPVAVTSAGVTEAGAVFDDEAIAAAQQLVIEHCERLGDRMALLDPPSGRGPLDVGGLRGWRARFGSSYAAVYAPWISVIDPLAAGGTGGQTRRLPPSGHIAGLIAGSDADIGPWRAPANRPLQWAVAVDSDFDDAAHAVLNGEGVNVLRPKPARGIVCLGARTISFDPAWRNVNVRRLFLYARRVLSGALAWTVFEPLDARLIALTDSVLAGFAEGLYAAGALAGDTEADSYRIRFDLTDPMTGVFGAELALAAARPNEFILLRVARTVDRLEFMDSTAATAGTPDYPALPLTGPGTP